VTCVTRRSPKRRFVRAIRFVLLACRSSFFLFDDLIPQSRRSTWLFLSWLASAPWPLGSPLISARGLRDCFNSVVKSQARDVSRAPCVLGW